MKWLPAVLAQVIERLPLERLLIKPRSSKEGLEELREILGESHAKPVEALPEAPVEEVEEGYLEPRRKVHLEPPPTNGVTTEETVAYHNREIAKHLNVLQKHYAQKLIIAGKKCDCGSSNHLLGIESLAEDTISMVSNPEIYYRLIEWVNENSPKSTTQAAQSGQYDNEYPILAHQARDFRKELICSLEPSVLYPHKERDAEILPVASEEEKVAKV